MIIAYELYGYNKNDQCEMGDICSIKCNPNISLICPVLYLKITGFSMIGFNILSLISQFIICPRKDEKWESASNGHSIFAFFIICWQFGLSIYGLIIYYLEINDLCKYNSKGQMILSWSIIFIIASLFGYCSLILAFTKQKNQFKQEILPQTSVEQNQIHPSHDQL